MSKILILGASGSGKSTSIGKSEQLGIEGLNPKETFIISCSAKGLPFRGWKSLYSKGEIDPPKGVITGNYYSTNQGEKVAILIDLINKARPDIKNIVIDDSNYIMQDYYMQNAMKGGWDTPKKIGLFMGKVFNAMESVSAEKNVIMIAHYEEFRSKNDDSLSYRMKTVGNMVNTYITPEGKFEIVLFATQEFNEQEKVVKKFFVTNYDGNFPAKSPMGMFSNIRIKNDLGYVIKKVEEYSN